MFRGDAQDPCVQWVTLTQTCMWNNGAASEGSTAQEGQEPSEGRAEDTASLNTGSRRGAEQTGGGSSVWGPGLRTSLWGMGATQWGLEGLGSRGRDTRGSHGGHSGARRRRRAGLGEDRCSSCRRGECGAGEPLL